jgi:hypothetical protein
LILLIVLIGPLQVNQVNVLRAVDQAFRPLIPNYPSISNAVIIYQALMIASIVAWLFTAWLIYKRESGTLSQMQTSYIVGATLRIGGSFSIVLLGGLPAEMTSAMVKEMLTSTVISVAVVVLWSLYLTRSVRVREIYT